MTEAKRASGSGLPVILGFAALVFFTFAFGLRFLWFFGETPLPPLLQGLPDSRTEADQQAFLARLRQTFPAGTPEADIASALGRQGFKLTASERAATFDRRAGLNDKCQRSGNVHWSLGADGRLSEVTGGYYQHCPAH